MKRAILALVLIFASASLSAQRPIEQTFAAGETLDYDLTWLGVTGAKARMTIAPIAGNRMRLTSIAASTSGFARVYKVRDEIESIIDASDFSTLDYRKHLNERGRIKDDRTVVDDKTNTATRTRPGKPPQQVHLKPPVFDPLSLIYHLRTLDLTIGKVHRFTVLADGKVYTLVATVLRKESVKTYAGTFRCVVVEPKMQGGGLYRDDDDSSLLVSYSDDESHIPVRIRSEVKVGTITATLRRVISGVTSVEPPK